MGTDRIDDFTNRRPVIAPKESARHKRVRRFVLHYLHREAKAGRRCPTNDEMRDICNLRDLSLPIDCNIAKLAHRGFLISEVYALNYRVIEIDGHRTAPPPEGGKPYKIIDGAKASAKENGNHG